MSFAIAESALDSPRDILWRMGKPCPSNSAPQGRLWGAVTGMFAALIPALAGS